MNYKDKAYKFPFRNRELSRTQVKNNILEVLNEASNETYAGGLNWYSDAYNFAQDLSKKSEYNIAQVVGVIAALSPMKAWEQNKKLAKEFILDGKRAGTFKNLVGKANDILNLGAHSDKIEDEVVKVLNGQKIVNFFLNIYHPNKDVAVTIDRHAIGIALLGSKRIKLEKEELTVTAKQFEFLVHCYKWASAEKSMSAIQLQAITWEHFRQLKY
tara:strand:- start:1194 stop:1835 length:642 start_codon:yes stop_codon:yes gene_type:complete